MLESEIATVERLATANCRMPLSPLPAASKLRVE